MAKNLYVELHVDTSAFEEEMRRVANGLGFITTCASTSCDDVAYRRVDPYLNRRKCTYCGQYGEKYHQCEHCGAPID